MRVQIMSDLHLDHWPLEPFDVEADVLAVAGDLAVTPRAAWEFFARVPRHVPCIYVLGNHEHDRRPFPALADYRRRLRTLPNVKLLENQVAEMSGVRFVGATLWSRVTPQQYRDVEQNMARVDTRATPARVTAVHTDTVRWLETAIPNHKPTVVVTHMAPSHRSTAAHHATSRVSSYFATNLEHLIRRTQPRMWVHGHMHDPVDYRCGTTRIVSNPRGYPGQNADFSPNGRIVDI